MIVLSYNHSRFILETLESARAQTYKNTELIILDDCSSDDSVSIIERWLQENAITCTFIRHQKNQGICKSLNEALAVATGKYISTVASDDLWLPDKTACQVEMMESQPEEVGVLYGEALQIDENGHPLPEMYIEQYWKLLEMRQGQLLDSLMLGCFILAQTALVRRSCYDKVGGFDQELRLEDWDMWMRIARHYSFAYLPRPFAKYRIHKNSLSHSDPTRVIRDHCHVCLKQLDLGGLTPHQKSMLTRMALYLVTQLCASHDEEASAILFALWQATGDREAGRRYRLAQLGPPFHALLIYCKMLPAVRKYVWHPILNVTRPIRHPLGLNGSNLRTILKRLE